MGFRNLNRSAGTPSAGGGGGSGLSSFTLNAPLSASGTLTDPIGDLLIHADNSLAVTGGRLQVGVLASNAQHGNRGNGSLHSVADGSNAGFMSAADFTKLAGIAASAAALGATAGANVTLSAGTAGSASTAAKSDHTHQLDVSIAPAWTGVHTWTNTALPGKFKVTDGAAAAQLEALRVSHTTSTTATNGIGAFIGFYSQDNAGSEIEVGRLVGIIRDVVAGSVDGVLAFYYQQNSTNSVGAFLNSGLWYAASGLAIASLSALGAVTGAVYQLSASSNMMTYASQATTNGGHAFTGAVNTSGARSFFVITPAANTAQTLSTAIKGFDYQTYTKQWATGTGPAEQAEIVFNAPTYSAVGASTFPLNTTVLITGAPLDGTNMTGTLAYALHVAANAKGGGVLIDQFVDHTEMTAPAAPPANTARVYAEDNGSGKTRLMCRFPTGAVQQLAIEP